MLNNTILEFHLDSIGLDRKKTYNDDENDSH